jgi:phosphoribosylglycinamide formyltransferase-1
MLLAIYCLCLDLKHELTEGRNAMAQKKLAVLVSGSGTLLDAIVEAGIEVAVVVADRPCLGLEKAEKYGITTELVNRKGWPIAKFDPESDIVDPARDDFTKQVVATLQSHDIDLVCMAGWMTVFTQAMFDAFGGRVTNNHPALLPHFKGAHAVRDALAAGAKVTGCTIHIATAVMDEGPILAQEEVAILPGDTEDSLQERIKVVERRLLPIVLKQLLAA